MLNLSNYRKIRKPTKTIAFVSNKGGVGKTHIAVNMAIQLAQDGGRVLLADTDLGSANADGRIGVSPAVTLLDFYHGNADISCCLTNTKYGFQLLAGKPGEFALANLDDNQIIRLLKAFDKLVQSGRYTHILFDLGAGISSRVLDFAIVSDEIIIVATPNEIIQAYSALKACWTRFTYLQNMEYFRTHTKINQAPAGMRNPYQDNHSGPRMNFIVNQVDNLEQGKNVFLRVTKVAREFFYTDDGYWELPMRYLGGIPDVHAFLKRAEQKRLPAIIINPHHEFSHAIKEVAKVLSARHAIAPDRIKRSFADKVKSVLSSWKTA